jgi:hypothetical protein
MCWQLSVGSYIVIALICTLFLIWNLPARCYFVLAVIGTLLFCYSKYRRAVIYFSFGLILCQQPPLDLGSIWMCSALDYLVLRILFWWLLGKFFILFVPSTTTRQRKVKFLLSFHYHARPHFANFRVSSTTTRHGKVKFSLSFHYHARPGLKKMWPLSKVGSVWPLLTV